MMQQYQEIKSQHKDALLLFRLGDFYELFGDDAHTASQVLQITLTKRNEVPMCGVPHHALDQYLPRLVHAGHKVAICEQVEDPTQAKGVVRREVVRIVTPGTLLDIQGEKEYVAALVERESCGLAFLDLGTGEFNFFEGRTEEAKEILERFSPSTLVLEDSQRKTPFILELKEQSPALFLDTLEDWAFSLETAHQLLQDHFGVATLSGFGCQDKREGVIAAGALLYYLTRLQNRPLVHVKKLSFYNHRKHLYLDPVALRHLELLKNMTDGTRTLTLLELLDKTKTPMGRRLLTHWILHPLLEPWGIEARWDALGELLEKKRERRILESLLAGVRDMERLTSRIALGLATPRDLALLRDSVKMLARVGETVATFITPIWSEMGREWDALEDLANLLETALTDQPPNTHKEGGIFRKGYHEELDRLKSLTLDGEQVLKEMEVKEREATGISSLKMRYNKVFGYYIEVTKAHLDKVPNHYERKQTLANAERYITPQLKELEHQLLSARERSIALEQELFLELRNRLAEEVKRLQEMARKVALVDTLLSLSQVAAERGYTRPALSTEKCIKITEGRHPIVDARLKEEFVPNSTILIPEERIHIITGPNMSGKSTYIRQTALLVIMAQMGSYVPAVSMEFSPVDRILTRIGTGDNLAGGRSTFMVEMEEVSNILNNATNNSLIILDEVGRGTSTYDGLALAWATVEHIHEKIRAYTLFATHYHELTRLAFLMDGVANYNVEVREWKDQVIFLHKVAPGATDRSYGIHVAQLAGLPEEVTKRAILILDMLEKGVWSPSHAKEQLPLFSTHDDPLRDELRLLDLHRLSPLEAILILERWRKKYL
jgi:DNA mismatch repair protein MutS